jgi:hypothetical protein
MINFKKIFAIGMIVVFVLSLSGCKKDDNPTASGGNIVGTWVLAKITATTAGGKLILTADQANVHVTITIKGDGTFLSTTIDANGTTNENGSYKVENGVATFTSQDGTTMVWNYTSSGSTLSASTTIDGTDFGYPGSLPVVLEFNKQ